MTKGYTYSIKNTHETQINEYRLFDNHENDTITNFSPTYVEILNIFRETFKLVDLTQIIRK